ncbi:amino acid adenylation domain-containing protein [Kocuria carniphila]|uniref:Amino acid adenylation domain-containing protein n=1 Tax=Kocuria carniphila TaxID=262208 RepID=A0ABV3V5L1_9MICC
MTTQTHTLWTLFQERTELHPERACVSDAAGEHTYREVGAASESMAAALEQVGVGRGDFVIVCSTPSADFLAAVLACFRLGAVYVPVDPTIPSERLTSIVTDIRPAAVVTDHEAADVAADIAAPHLIVGSVPAATAGTCYAGDGNDIAYVIYTSGSTGKPKGVLVTHNSVLHLVNATNREMDLTPEDVWSVTHSYAFDVSVWEVWSALSNGGRMVMVPRSTVRAADRLLELLVEERVSVLSQTPTALYQLIAAEEAAPATAREAVVRYIVLAGEALDTARVQRWHEVRAMSPLLVNLYGITEGTVHVTYFDYTSEHRAEADGRSIVGDAFGEGELLLLDSDLKSVAVGEVGELYLAGPGVAAGYWGRQALTSTRFVACPWAPGAVMYRSGDLARQTSLGLEYLGRADKQVKIRGYRIELGEIQSVLDTQSEVRDSAVVVERTNDESAVELIAYVRPLPNSTPPRPQDLRESLSRVLPDYMVPNAFVAVTDWPMNQNGKLDEAALPRPTRTDRTGQELIEPRDGSELAVVEAWREVLGIDEIGVHDDFFQLGGDSMAAHRVARILLPYGYIEARQVLQVRQPARLAEILSAAAAAPRDADETTDQHESALTPTQRRFWYEQLEYPQSAHLNVSVAFELRGQPDAKRLREAIDACVKRREVLRTRIDLIDGDAHVSVAPATQDSWEWRQISTRNDDEFGNAVAEVTGRSFDLSRDAVFRAHLIQDRDRRSVLVLVMHHAVVDGWSLAALVDEIGSWYRGGGTTTAETAVRHSGQVEGRLSDDRRELMRDWWARELADAPTPVRRSAPAGDPTAGAAHRFTLDEFVATSLRELSARNGVTLYTVLMTLTSAVLARNASQCDTTIGCVVSGRDDPRLADLTEPVINTVPVRLPLSAESTVVEAIAQVADRLNAAMDHQDLPYEEILTAGQVPRVSGQLPLLDALVVLQDAPAALDLGLDLPAARLPLARRSAVHNLTIEYTPNDAGDLEVMFEHRTASMSPAQAVRLERALRAAVADAIAHPSRKIGDLDMLGTADAAELAHFASAPLPEDALGMSAPERIQATFDQDPESVALSDVQGEMTYAELDALSAGLARRLLRLGVTTGDPVAIRAERGRYYVASLVAVWRACGVPILLDPNHPASRARSVIDEAGANVVIQTLSTATDLRVRSSVVLSEESDFSAETGDLPSTFPQQNERAYVIYTSGSTGKPKGVAVPHSALEAMVLAHVSHFGLTAQDRAAHFSGLGFDASVWDIVPALCAGARIDIPAPGELDSPSAYGRWLADRGTTICFISSPVTELLLDESSVRQNHTLRFLLTGGSALRRTRPASMRPRLVNNYGPTETTIIATTGEVFTEDTEQAPPHIGGPRAGTTLHILDHRLRPVPVGTAGELYIAGTGVAEGYVSRPELTAERFVANPFEPGTRMYRSGDIAAWREDGNVHYLGRNDSQLQVRGVRVELAEIAQVLSAVCDGRQTHVLASSTGHDAQLDAFVAGASPLDEQSVRAELARRLPEQMVPRSIRRIDALPLTPNDKIDEAQLRAEIARPREVSPDQPAPLQSVSADDIERFRRLWCEVLDVPDVEDTANYFALGGDSIRTLKLVALARKAEFTMSSKDVFDHQTFAEMATAVIGQTAHSVGDSFSTVSVEDGAQAPLLPAQHLLLTELHGSSLAAMAEFHQVLTVGVKAEPHTIRRALRKLAERHPALRTGFQSRNGAWEQVERSTPVGEITRITESSEAGHSWVTGPMAIELGEMVRATISRGVGRDTSEMTLVIHHLAVDNVSWAVLLEELNSLIAERSLTPRTDSTASQHARRLQQFALSNAGSELAERWARLDAGTSAVEAPFPAGRYGETRSVKVAITKEETDELLRRILPQLGTNMDEVLIAALGTGLVDWTGSGTYRIALEGHGRDNDLPTLTAEQTVGWLTAYTPVSLRFSAGEFIDRLWSVHGAMAELPEPRASAGALRFSGRPGALATLPRPWISLNYLGELRTSRNDAFTSPPVMDLHAAKRLPRLHAIDVVASVRDGALTIDVTHHQSAQDEEMTRLAETVRTALRTLLSTDRAQLEVTPRVPLTDLQSGLLMHHLADRDRNLYVEQARVRLPYAVDTDRMQHAWDATIDETEVLRTSLQWRGVPEPVQVIHPSADLRVDSDDLRMLSDEARSQRADALAAEDRRSGVSLTEAPLACVRLLRLDDNETELVWTFQHIVLDGWSAMKVLGRVLDRYTLGSEPAETPAAAPPYSEYVRWLRGAGTSRAEQYWAEVLARGSDRITMVGTRTPDKASGGSTAEHCREFDFDLDELEQAARRLQVTRGALAQAAWALCLAGTEPTAQTAFGIVVSGRSAPMDGIEDVIGLLINTVPMIVDVDSDASVEAFVTGVQARNMEMQEHEHLSLPRIQQLAGSPTRPLFDTMLVVENYPLDAVSRHGIELLDIRFDTGTNYPLNLVVHTAGSRGQLDVLYDDRVFSEVEIEAIGRRYEESLTFLMRAPGHTLIGTQGSPRLEKLSQSEGSDTLPTPTAADETPSDDDLVQIVQARVAECFREVLDTSAALSADADFLALGGDSLSTLRLMGRLETEFDVEVNPIEIFDAPTVREVAGNILRRMVAQLADDDAHEQMRMA